MLMHCLAKLKTWKLYLFTKMVRVEWLIDAQITSEVSLNHC